jgi:hypothetical protein
MSALKGSSIWRKLFITAGIALVVLFLGMFAYRLVTGRSLGLRSLATSVYRVVLSPVNAARGRETVMSYSQGDYKNIVFLHHSIGRNIILDGDLREMFSQAGYYFWDQDYNPIGLRDPAGNYTNYAYLVPGDNTDPDGLARVFSQAVYDTPANALSGLLQHEVIVFKSCFPASDIPSDEKLEESKNYYLPIRETISQHPDKIFILLTQPPLNAARTDADDALRARQLANWLVSDEFKGELENLFVFDLYDQLAESDPASPTYNMLRLDYSEERDNHPVSLANQKIAAQIFEFVEQAINQYVEKNLSTSG